MRIIDADKYQKELLSAYDDVSMEFEVLDRQPLVSAIPIPDGATNGDMIKTMFPNGKEYDNDGDVRYEIEIDFDYSFCSYFDGVWWNAPYKGNGNLSEKPTGSESEDSK
jgi:hypothetical protein